MVRDQRPRVELLLLGAGRRPEQVVDRALAALLDRDREQRLAQVVRRGQHRRSTSGTPFELVLEPLARAFCSLSSAVRSLARRGGRATASRSAGVALDQGVGTRRGCRALASSACQLLEPLAEVEVLVLEGVGELVHDRRPDGRRDLRAADAEPLVLVGVEADDALALSSLISSKEVDVALEQAERPEHAR